MLNLELHLWVRCIMAISLFKFNGKSQIASVSGNVKIKSEFSGNVQFDVITVLKS